VSPVVALPGPADTPGTGLAVASFALVLTSGVGLLAWRPAAVDRAVDRTADESPLAAGYGVVAFVLVALVGGYVLSQAARAGLDGTTVRWLGVLVLGTALTALGSFGYLVVGAYLTEANGPRRPWVGAVVGAVVSAVPWLALPTLPALVVWTLVAAAGLGGPTRHYIHDDRSLQTETR
jgi:hypothetical protein